jgi:hypothetical protein
MVSLVRASPAAAGVVATVTLEKSVIVPAASPRFPLMQYGIANVDVSCPKGYTLLGYAARTSAEDQTIRGRYLEEKFGSDPAIKTDGDIFTYTP